MADYPLTPHVDLPPDQSIELRKQDETQYFKQLATDLARIAFKPQPFRQTLCLECSEKFEGRGQVGYCPACAYSIYREET